MSIHLSPLQRLILAVYVPTLLLAFGMGLLIPIMPLYAGSFEVSYWLIGIALSAQGMGNMVGDLPAGRFNAQLGQNRTMVLGLIIMTASMGVLGVTKSFPALLLFYFLSGTGMALYNISRHAFMAELIQVEQRGRAIAIFGGINRIGTFIGPAVGGFVGAAYGLRAPIQLFAVFTAIAIIFPLLFGRDPEPSEEAVAASAEAAAHGPQGHLAVFLKIVRENTSILLSAGSGMLLAQMIRSGRKVIIPLFAADVLGLEPDAIGLIVSISGGVDMVMFPLAGMLMDRFGRKYAYVPCFLGQGIAMALIPLTLGFWSLLVVSCLMGISNGVGSGTMMTLGADLSPPEARGEFLGIWRLLGDLGQTGAPIVVGGVAETLSLAIAALVIAVAGVGAAAVLGLRVPETLQKQIAVPNAN